MTGGRTLSDEDVKAIVDHLVPVLREKVVSEFYSEFGRGLWSWSIKVIIALILVVGANMTLNGKVTLQ